ncbi:hypothetical protein UPYG_G00168450 [Umbra pygmaea]|uniref:Calcium binding and coiled-coil domain-containing protein n=1 Tax=Umbra pygmaea TaxID=75934 RepID=A0ABD0WN40_UMBPY
MQFSQESLSTLLDEKAESLQRIKELEDDIIALTQRREETEAELDRMKERVKKMSTQLRDEEKEKNHLQMETGAVLAEMREMQKRLEASEREAEGLRQDLSAMGAQQSHNHAEVHQARLQAAQLTLQQSEADLALREGRAHWAKEREAFRQAAELDKEKVQKLSRELQRKEEWLREERLEREKLEEELEQEKDCSRLVLNDARKELQEVKASLRKYEKEREQMKLERQDLLDYVHVLEKRLEVVTDNKWTDVALFFSNRCGADNQSDNTSEVEKLSLEDEKLPSSLAPWSNFSFHRSVTRPKTGVDEEEQHNTGTSEDKSQTISAVTKPILSELADCSPFW